MRREVDLSGHLSKCRDAALFVFSVTSKQSKTDFVDFNDWYERSAGFDKPWLIISARKFVLQNI